MVGSTQADIGRGYGSLPQPLADYLHDDMQTHAKDKALGQYGPVQLVQRCICKLHRPDRRAGEDSRGVHAIPHGREGCRALGSAQSGQCQALFVNLLNFNWLARGNLGANTVLIGKAESEEKKENRPMDQWHKRTPTARQGGRLEPASPMSPHTGRLNGRWSVDGMEAQVKKIDRAMCDKVVVSREVSFLRRGDSVQPSTMVFVLPSRCSNAQGHKTPSHRIASQPEFAWPRRRKSRMLEAIISLAFAREFERSRVLVPILPLSGWCP